MSQPEKQDRPLGDGGETTPKAIPGQPTPPAPRPSAPPDADREVGSDPPGPGPLLPPKD